VRGAGGIDLHKYHGPIVQHVPHQLLTPQHATAVDDGLRCSADAQLLLHRLREARWGGTWVDTRPMCSPLRIRLRG
jgi:hypothetical protein